MMPQTAEPGTMSQTAPYPAALDDLVKKTKYRPDWEFSLVSRDRGQGSKGLTLSILILCEDTYNPGQEMRVVHYFIVPAASFNEQSWRRWLFERILEVERHEAAEFFQIDGVRPYAPNHGPGHDPYIIFEEGSRQDKRTDYLGNRRETDAPREQT